MQWLGGRRSENIEDRRGMRVGPMALGGGLGGLLLLLLGYVFGVDPGQISQGYVVPETFTHGSAEQRVRWFQQGFRSGTFSGCKST